MNATAPAMLPDCAAEPADSTIANAAANATRPRFPQTGPVTDEGKEASKRNSVRHGLTGAGLVLPPEMEQIVAQLRDEFSRTYQPGNAEDWRWVDQAALGFARYLTAISEQTYFVWSRTDRAVNTWDEDQAIEAAKLGNRLARQPGWVVAKLETSLAGSRWLLERWKHLGWALDHRGDWDEAERSTALYLQGVPTGLHPTAPTVAGKGTREQRRSLVASQVARLEKRIHGVLADLDRSCREMAIRGNGYMLEPGYHRLHRYERSAFLSYERAIAALKNRDQAPAVRTAAPAPAPAPKTKVSAPAPSPKVSAPAPSPKVSAPAPSPKVSAPAPVVKRLPPAPPLFESGLIGEPLATIGHRGTFDELDLPGHGRLLAKCRPELAAKAATLRLDPGEPIETIQERRARHRRQLEARKKSKRC